MDPNIAIVVHPGTNWSSKALTVPYWWQPEVYKKVLGKNFFYGVFRIILLLLAITLLEIVYTAAGVSIFFMVRGG